MAGFRTDVSEWRSPTVKAIRGLITRLGRRELTVPQFQREVLRTYRGADLWTRLGPHIEDCLANRRDRILWREIKKTRDFTLQLIYLEPNTAHPPHYHFNHVSTQLVMAGRMRAREYERLTRITDDSVLLMPVFDGVHEVGDTMQTSEFHRNVHWFAAETEPTVFLNFNVHGLEPETFEPDTRQRKGRNAIDPTVGGNECHVVGHKMDIEKAEAKFAQRPIDDFPLIVQPEKNTRPQRVSPRPRKRAA